MKRSYLFVTWEGGGNVPPVLGVARRLTARGHSVRVLTEPCLEPAVRETGADFVPFTRYFTRAKLGEDLMGDWQAKSPMGALRQTMKHVLLGPARIVAEETQRALTQSQTDVLVADMMMLGSLAAAEAARIPRVVLFHMPEYLPGPGRPAAGPGFLPRNDLVGRLRDGLLTGLLYRTVGDFLPDFNDARRALGLAPLKTAQELLGEYHRADLRLIQTLEAFDFPIKPAPANVRYVGPTLDDPSWIAPWQNPWPAEDQRPLVVASLSSTFQNQQDALQRIIAALGSLDVRGLVTLGPAMADVVFNLPPNVKALPAVSHAQVFPHAAAVVSHAGHGTVMRGLAHGLPLLCLPMGRDQDDNAARVVAHGAGLRLKRSAKPQQIARAVQQLLDQPDHRWQAQRLGQLVSQDVAADRAVHELERVGIVPETRPVQAREMPIAASPQPALQP
jgi:UDP:flavonoid glycosyltransferase YjiC (YdhE family)